MPLCMSCWMSLWSAWLRSFRALQGDMTSNRGGMPARCGALQLRCSACTHWIGTNTSPTASSVQVSNRPTGDKRELCRLSSPGNYDTCERYEGSQPGSQCRSARTRLPRCTEEVSIQGGLPEQEMPPTPASHCGGTAIAHQSNARSCSPESPVTPAPGLQLPSPCSTSCTASRESVQPARYPWPNLLPSYRV